MNKIRVAVNGYGVTGKRIANATASINRKNDSMGIIQEDIFKQLFKWKYSSLRRCLKPVCCLTRFGKNGNDIGVRRGGSNSVPIAIGIQVIIDILIKLSN